MLQAKVARNDSLAKFLNTRVDPPSGVVDDSDTQVDRRQTIGAHLNRYDDYIYIYISVSYVEQHNTQLEILRSYLGMTSEL